MSDDRLLLVLSTCPSAEAETLAENLIAGKLAACVNITAVKSVYFWKNELIRENESLLIIKTTELLYPNLAARLKEIHPYEVPEIVAIRPDSTWPDYLQWVAEQTRRDKSSEESGKDNSCAQ